ncbi:MAG: Gfo/Idh/MocA family oxidoreductase, partial [Planctomycetaceae bacterium]|nr:Gfo/Idh/MocA family oxidoreductase [Planctomycetaceae bacterium]
NHTKLLANRKDVKVAYVCDVDQQRLQRAVGLVKAGAGTTPKAVTDLREILKDPQIEAVFIATPDHWHAPAAVLALEHGKHVYVEKPMCHNIREGRLTVDAVHRSGKRLQVGTQSRSTPFIHEAIQQLRNGEIGDVLVAKAWNSQRRGSIGKTQPSEPPGHLDFDLWVGPAQKVPYRSNLLHGVWRWWYEFGCGDIGNDGVHDIDVALWGLDVKTHPSTVTCLGGKYFFDDDQQFPDTQYAVFEYAGENGKPSKQLVFEQRIWSPYKQEGYENGAAFYGTKGMLILGHTQGWKLYGPRNKLIAEKTGSVDLPGHHQNFFDCIRNSDQSLNADVNAGHRAATIVHLANISARLGRTLQFDPQQETFKDDQQANLMLGRSYRENHWADPTQFANKS